MNVAGYLQQSYTWVDQNLGTAVMAAFRNEREEALAAMDSGLGGLASSGLDTDLQDHIRVRARYMRWQIECLGITPEEEARLRSELIAEFTDYQGTPYATAAANMYLLQLRTLAWRDDGIAYPHEEFKMDLAALPDWGRSLELYIYIATCAFWHKDLEVLEDCFGVITTNSDGFMADYLWQRVNVMYQLLKGTATERDVEELLARIEHPHQWFDIERVVLPACFERGLCNTNGVSHAMGTMLYRLHSNAPEMPKRLRKTGRIMRD